MPAPLIAMPAEPSRVGPIGVFDSGVGGLSVVRSLWSLLPAEDILYVGDSANCPYGPRPPAEIQRFALGIGRYLLDHGAKALVVACNTASGAALSVLRATFPDVPIVGMVPAIKPAAAWSRTRVVGVLATPLPLNGSLYGAVVREHAEGVRVLNVVCPGLVEAVERGETDSPALRESLQRCLQPMLDEHADALVLGCTHYPFLRRTIEALCGDRMHIFETGEPVARQTQRVLAAAGLAAAVDTVGTTVLVSTRSAAHLQASAKALLGVELPTREARWSETGLHDLAV